MSKSLATYTRVPHDFKGRFRGGFDMAKSAQARSPETAPKLHRGASLLASGDFSTRPGRREYVGRVSDEIVAYMVSCQARDSVRAGTLERLAATDWLGEVAVVLDEVQAERAQERQERTSRRLLEIAAAEGVGFVLFLEDDLDFNEHLRHNLTHWTPLLSAGPDGQLLGSLYDPGVRALSWDHDRAFSIADPELVYGSQAFLLSRATVLDVLAGWDSVPGMQDIKISRLAAAAGPIYYHRPSLVQHVDAPSTWGGPRHWASDFSSSWRAPEVALSG